MAKAKEKQTKAEQEQEANVSELDIKDDQTEETPAVEEESSTSPADNPDGAASETPVATPKKKFNLKQWVRVHKWATAGIVAAVLVVAALGVWFTDAKFAVLNLFGKSSLELLITDDKTNQPVPNAKVTVDSQSAQSAKDGKVTITNIHYGNDDVTVEKLA